MIQDLRGEHTCGAEGCDRPLTEPELAFETAAGRREAHECVCGAVTITLSRPESSR